MKPCLHPINTTGFSFIELLITLAVFSLLVGGLFAVFTSQRDTYLREALKLERDQNLGVAMDTLLRELSAAGYRAADGAFVDGLSRWVPSAYIPSEPLPVNLDANPKITLGDAGLPDVITFACAVPTATNPTTLSGDADGSLVTVSLSNSDAEEQYRPGDIISVGYLPEYAVVADVDGNTLTVDADPEASGAQPLSTPYPSGTPLEEISIVSYAVFNDDNDPLCKRHDAGCPLLKRKINAGGFYPVAENIRGLKASEPADGVLQISLTGLAAGSETADAGNARTLAARVLFRNALPPGFASVCTQPAAPGGLAADGGLDESLPCRILVSWDPVTKDVSGGSLADAGCPVTGYRVYFDSVPGAFGYFVAVSPEDAAGYALDVSGVLSAAYHISVAAENSSGLGEKSPEMMMNDTTGPERTEGVSAAVAGADAIAVSWDENAECDLAGYYLYRKKGGSALELVSGLIPAGAGGYTDAGLDAGADYSYTVEAVDFGYNAGEASAAVTVWLP